MIITFCFFACLISVSLYKIYPIRSEYYLSYELLYPQCVQHLNISKMTQEGTLSSMLKYVNTFNSITQSKEILFTKYIYDMQYKTIIPVKCLNQKRNF